MYQEQNNPPTLKIVITVALGVAFVILIATISLCLLALTFGLWRTGPTTDDVHATAYDFRWEICRVERMYDPAATSFLWTNPDGSSVTMPCPASSSAPLPWPTTIPTTDTLK